MFILLVTLACIFCALLFVLGATLVSNQIAYERTKAEYERQVWY